MRYLFRFYLILLCSLPVITYAAETGPVFPGLDGKRHALANYVGQSKWTVVGIWGPRCRYCHAEMPERQRMYQSRSRDINVVGIAIDYPTMGLANVSEVRDFVRKYQLT